MHVIILLFLIFFFQKIFSFFVPLNKVLLELLPEATWETFSACLKVLDNLCEVFGYFHNN